MKNYKSLFILLLANTMFLTSCASFGKPTSNSTSIVPTTDSSVNSSSSITSSSGILTSSPNTSETLDSSSTINSSAPTTLHPTGTVTNKFSNQVCEEVKVYLIETASKYGDMILTVCGDFAMVIDNGGGSGNSKDGNLLKEYISKYANNDIDLLIYTHPDQDHISGAKQFFDYLPGNPVGIDYNIDTIIDFGFVTNTATFNLYKEIRDELVNRQTNYCTAYEIVNKTRPNVCPKTLNLMENLTFEILDTGAYPSDSTKIITDSSSINNGSVAGLLKMNDFTFYLSGDLEIEGERQLVSKKEVTDKVTIMKADHHAAYSANASELIKVLDPRAVVISTAVVSNNNKYDGGGNEHPQADALNRIYQGERVKDNVYLNMTNGTLVVSAKSDSEYSIVGEGTRYYKKDGKVLTGENNLKLSDTYFFNNIIQTKQTKPLSELVTINK